MEKFDAIIIGSGMGGLISGAILAKEGQKILVLERGKKIGGLLHTFKRDQMVFNTGMNYVGALEEGGYLNNYLSYLGVMDKLNISRLDIDGFDEISFSNSTKTYSHAQGKENFVRHLVDDFPTEAEAIQKYINKIWNVTDRFPLLHLKKENLGNRDEAYFMGGAADFIASCTDNHSLRQVLGATNTLYGGVEKKTPLYTHALVNRHLINSAWRFVGGSQHLADALKEKIEEAGGQVINRTEVVKISTEDIHNSWVETLEGHRFFAKNIISNIHPSTTLRMVEDRRLKQVYRKRIHNLPNSTSFFNVYLIFKKQQLQYINRNFYHFLDDKVWFDEHHKNWPGFFIFYTSCGEKNQKWATHGTLMTSMSYADVARWSGTKKGMRGDDYEAFKKKKAEQLIDELNKKIPGIKANIQSYYTATPLTYEHYLNTPGGTAYGVQKDYHSVYQGFILPRTKIPNLFFTGQNLNMHGALGVTIGGVLTTSEILGADYLLDKIRSSLGYHS